LKERNAVLNAREQKRVRDIPWLYDLHGRRIIRGSFAEEMRLRHWRLDPRIPPRYRTPSRLVALQAIALEVRTHAVFQWRVRIVQGSQMHLSFRPNYRRPGEQPLPRQPG